MNTARYDRGKQGDKKAFLHRLSVVFNHRNPGINRTQDIGMERVTRNGELHNNTFSQRFLTTNRIIIGT